MTAFLCVIFPSSASAQATYSTGFEPPEFVLGDVNGQNGWGHGDNSFTGGAIEPLPPGSPVLFGAQYLAVRTRNVINEGVRNHLYSAVIDPPAGETGSTRGGVVVPNPQPVFQASFWYHTPPSPVISTLTTGTAAGRFAELNPSSKGLAAGEVANRYAQVRLFNTTNDPAGRVGVEMRWFTSTATLSPQVATLDWNEWYRFEYLMHLVDGTSGAEPNDRFTLKIFDVDGNLVGSGCGSTWELGWKSGTFGGTATARAVNGFDFFSLTRPNNTLVGHIDNFFITTGAAPAAVTVGISGDTSACIGNTTSVTASASGGTGAFGYVWRNASDVVVGTAATLMAGAGTYTVTATDELCVTATNTVVITEEDCRVVPVVTWANPADIVYGTPLGPAQLNATADVAGTFVYSPPAGTLLNAGSDQVLTVDFFPTDTASYHNVEDTTVTLNVLKAPTTLTITDIFPGPSTAGEPVTVMFDLDGTFGTPGGTIVVTDGVDSCTAAATATSCSMSLTSAGDRTITATYSGDANHFGSSAAGRPHRVELGFPTARVDGSTSICAGDSASIRVRLTGIGPWTLTWSDGAVETATSPTHRRTVTPRATTPFSLVSVRDRNSEGEATGTAIITIREVAPPQIAEAAFAEPGGRAVLRATPGYTSYQWFRNGQPVAGATSSELVIDPVLESDFTSYTVTGTQEGCVSPPSASRSISRVALGSDDAVIPVVGTVHGFNGSLFRTTVHLSNGTASPIRGEITFIDANVPVYAYTLAPGETRFVEDLLPPSFGGLTSANIRRISGPLPVVVAHIFNDEEGPAASGMIERAIPVRETLEVGDRAVLVTPIDPETTRFNLGIRSLGEGMRVRVARRDAFGTLTEIFERELGPSALTHEPLLSASGESLTFEVLSGGGVIYGAATDNRTNDPNMQIATKIGQRPDNGHLVLPVAGSGPGRFGSFFSTALQVHNPGHETISATLLFTPGGVRHSIIVGPGTTASFEDIVATMGASGFGSLELITAAEIYPIVLARIYNIAEDGETSLMTDLIPIEDVLLPGDEPLLVAPHAPEESRFNVGMRTFGEGVRFRATVRNSSGAIVHEVTRTAGGDQFLQDTASKLLGYEFTGDESVSFLIQEGSAAIYGVWTNNVTQDPAMQYAVE